MDAVEAVLAGVREASGEAAPQKEETVKRLANYIEELQGLKHKVGPYLVSFPAGCAGGRAIRCQQPSEHTVSCTAHSPASSGAL